MLHSPSSLTSQSHAQNGGPACDSSVPTGGLGSTSVSDSVIGPAAMAGIEFPGEQADQHEDDTVGGKSGEADVEHVFYRLHGF